MDKLYFGQCWTSNSLQISNSRWRRGFCSKKFQLHYLNTFHKFFSPASGEGRRGAIAVVSLRVVRNLINYHYNYRKEAEGWGGSHMSKCFIRELRLFQTVFKEKIGYRYWNYRSHMCGLALASRRTCWWCLCLSQWIIDSHQ